MTDLGEFKNRAGETVDMKPIPDGYLIIRFRTPIRPEQYTYDERGFKLYPDEAYNMRVEFRELKWWQEANNNIVLRFEETFTNIPLTSVMYYDVKLNSVEYSQRLARYNEMTGDID